MTIKVDIEGMPEVSWEDLWPRQAHFGEAHGYCGADVIIAISRVFSTDEDKLLAWVDAQDEADLYAIQHLEDGRDMFIFNRTWASQSREDAEMEHRLHLRALIRKLESQRPLFPGQRNMTQSDTRNLQARV